MSGGNEVRIVYRSSEMKAELTDVSELADDECEGSVMLEWSGRRYT